MTDQKLSVEHSPKQSLETARTLIMLKEFIKDYAKLLSKIYARTIQYISKHHLP